MCRPNCQITPIISALMSEYIIFNVKKQTDNELEESWKLRYHGFSFLLNKAEFLIIFIDGRTRTGHLSGCRRGTDTRWRRWQTEMERSLLRLGLWYDPHITSRRYFFVIITNFCKIRICSLRWWQRLDRTRVLWRNAVVFCYLWLLLLFGGTIFYCRRRPPEW